MSNAYPHSNPPRRKLSSTLGYDPAWLEAVSIDPIQAKGALLDQMLKRKDAEDTTQFVRQQMDRMRRKQERTELAYNQAMGQFTKAELAHKQTTEKLEALEQREVDYNRKVWHLQRDQKKEEWGKELDAHRLNRREGELKAREREVRKREGELQTAKMGGCAVSAISKLAKNKTIGRRLAAAVHPDKFPDELSEAASDLFKFVQTLRETEASSEAECDV